MDPKELKFYDLKSDATAALADLKKNCEETGRDWVDELNEVLYDVDPELTEIKK